MNLLSQDDFRNLLWAIEQIYAPTDIDNFPAMILSALYKVLPCNTICYNDVYIPESKMTWITEPFDALPSPALQAMFNRYLHEHPLIAHSPVLTKAGSSRISDFLSKQQFHRLALYNEYYRPLGVEYQLGMALSISADRIVAIALDRDCMDFSETDRLYLDLLGPHLRQSYKNLQVLRLMKRVVAGSRNRVVIVSRTNQDELLSEEDRLLFAEYFNMPRLNRHLPDTLVNWVKFERSRLNQKTEIPSSTVPMTISKKSSKLVIHFLWGGKGSENDMLLLEEQRVDATRTPPTGSKLTKRETEILMWLSQGMTNVEIGDALFISTGTVKKHLDHIYSKLGVHRRSGAAALQAYLPAKE